MALPGVTSPVIMPPLPSTRPPVAGGRQPVLRAGRLCPTTAFFRGRRGLDKPASLRIRTVVLARSLARVTTTPGPRRRKVGSAGLRRRVPAPPVGTLAGGGPAGERAGLAARVAEVDERRHLFAVLQAEILANRGI